MRLIHRFERLRSRRRANRSAHTARFDQLEPRQLLASGFLQGVSFTDLNANNRLDVNEPRLSGVTIELQDMSGGLIATAVTDGNGGYRFDSLEPGTYRLVETAPPGYVNQGTELVSDMVPAQAIDNRTIEVVLPDFDVTLNHYLNRGPGQTAGYVLVGGLFPEYRGFVGEFSIRTTFGSEPGADLLPPFPSYCVDLFHPVVVGQQYKVEPKPILPSLNESGNGAQIAYLYNHVGRQGFTDNDQAAGFQFALYELIYDTDASLTNTNGKFYVTDAPAGAIAAGEAFLRMDWDPESAVYLDGTVSQLQGMIAALSFNFGNVTETPPVRASLGDYVFEDRNANGIQDDGEPGVSGVTVNLLAGGSIVATTTTDANGLYLFPNLDAGTYQVRFVRPANAVFTIPNASGSTIANDSDAYPDPSTALDGLTPTITLAAGEANRTVDAGLIFDKAALGDYVFIDANNDGIQDPGGTGVNGVTVELLQGGVVVRTTTTLTNPVTSRSGFYYIPNLDPNTPYQVRFSNLPSGYVLAKPLQGDDTTLDSDAVPNPTPPGGTTSPSGTTPAITLAAGEYNPTIDAGIIQGAALGDYVWNDLNNNGIQDADEPGVPGVAVSVKDATGAVIATTTTDANGFYYVPGLTPGSYSVGFTRPSGFVFAKPNQGTDDALDSDADPLMGMTPLVTLVNGQYDSTLDAGLVAGAALGNFVWNDTNNNGIQDANEPGVPGVAVSVKDATGAVIATTTTDANGFYYVPGLTPGSYSVGFTRPSGFVFAKPNQGTDDALDSDADPLMGMTPLVTLVNGQYDSTLDAGLVQGAALGNYVWNDLNINGIQDANEPGVAGVAVSVQNLSGVTVATTTTDANGFYYVPGLTPGLHKVTFTRPSGFVFTRPNQGTDDALDSDADILMGMTPLVNLANGEYNPTLDAGVVAGAALGNFVWNDVNNNGIQDGEEDVVAGVPVSVKDATGAVIATTATDANGFYYVPGLAPGSYSVGFTRPSGFVFAKPNQGTDDALDSDAVPLTGMTPLVTLAAGEYNPTLDAGLVQGAALGNFVWNDLNNNGLQDADERGVAGVTVAVKTGTTTVATTTTDEDGFYYVPGLTPGTPYTVMFSALPSGYVLARPRIGTNSALDSDAVPDPTPAGGTTSPSGTTDAVTLAAGEYNPTIDAGIVQGAALGDHVWVDVNNNGLQDSNESGLAGIPVTVTNTVTGGTVATTTTDANGFYYVPGLLPGSYKVTFTKPSNRNFTIQNPSDPTLDSNADPTTGMTPTYTLVNGQYDSTIDAGLTGVIEPSKTIPGPTATLQRYGIHAQPTRLVVLFNQPMDRATVTNPRNYRLTWPGADGQIGTADDRRIPVQVLRYQPALQRVILKPIHPGLNEYYTYQLVVSQRITNSNGLPLNSVVQVIGEGTQFVTPPSDTVIRFDHRAIAGFTTHNGKLIPVDNIQEILAPFFPNGGQASQTRTKRLAPSKLTPRGPLAAVSTGQFKLNRVRNAQRL